ncbi:hypothetical protein J6590_079896 [Homalodisca vitripennis]|nr:hypothetical protein J6590_079896 [Homalodisca vitripennis]
MLERAIQSHLLNIFNSSWSPRLDDQQKVRYLHRDKAFDSFTDNTVKLSLYLQKLHTISRTFLKCQADITKVKFVQRRWVTAERSCPCKQLACPAIGGGSEVTFNPLVPGCVTEGFLVLTSPGKIKHLYFTLIFDNINP